MFAFRKEKDRSVVSVASCSEKGSRIEYIQHPWTKCWPGYNVFLDEGNQCVTHALHFSWCLKYHSFRVRSRITQSSVPHVFGPLESGSGSISQRYRSWSGSFYHQAKILRKTLIPTVLWLLLDFLSMKNGVNVPSKSNKQKNFFLIPGSGSGYICQRPRSADPDPDQHQNVMDAEHESVNISFILSKHRCSSNNGSRRLHSNSQDIQVNTTEHW